MHDFAIPLGKRQPMDFPSTGLKSNESICSGSTILLCKCRRLTEYRFCASADVETGLGSRWVWRWISMHKNSLSLWAVESFLTQPVSAWNVKCDRNNFEPAQPCISRSIDLLFGKPDSCQHHYTCLGNPVGPGFTVERAWGLKMYARCVSSHSVWGHTIGKRECLWMIASMLILAPHSSLLSTARIQWLFTISKSSFSGSSNLEIVSNYKSQFQSWTHVLIMLFHKVTRTF